jgi:ketosteroid isomerase-like protein
MSKSDFAGFRALDPFFAVVMEGLSKFVDGDHYFDTLDDDVLFEFRYDFPGWPQVTRGRASVVALYSGYGNNIRLDRGDYLIAHHSENGRVVILEYEVHGKILATDTPYVVSRRYRPGTLILETEFQTESGSAAVVDFMAFGDGAHLLRIVMGRTGRMDFRTEFVVRFNYGSTVPWVNRLDDGVINAIAGPGRVVLRAPIALYGEDLRTVGDFAVEAGEIRCLRPFSWALVCKPAAPY